MLNFIIKLNSCIIVFVPFKYIYQHPSEAAPFSQIYDIYKSFFFSSSILAFEFNKDESPHVLMFEI